MRRMYSKAQIEAMGGTKLYKHTIKIKDDLSQELNIIIISGTESFSNWRALREDSRRVIGYVVDTNNYFTIVGIELADAINYFNGGTFQKVQMMMPRIDSDIVEAL